MQLGREMGDEGGEKDKWKGSGDEEQTFSKSVLHL